MSSEAQSTAPAPEPTEEPKKEQGKAQSLSGVRILRGLASGVGFLYAALCGFLWFDQEHFIFFPSTDQSVLTPSAFRIPFEDVWIPVPSSPEEKLHGWWIPNPGTRRLLLYLHGNGGNISANLEHAVRMRNLGTSVLIMDYRGYGRSNGRFPSESRVYEDAETAWQYLVRERNVSPSDIVIYGHSLGGAIAIELASHHPEAAGLITESTFTSIIDMARNERAYSWLPVGLLVRQNFASIAKVPLIRMPILFIHGTGDEIAPYRMSEQLYNAAPGVKKLILIEGAGHEDCAITGGEKYDSAVRSFLTSPSSS
jgi:pimeloyl-ACP methyl ester carboxylesterase